jgi:acyl carrier protein phosphodiesterase
MNHLAHCFLAQQNPDWIVGNMVADYVRGSVRELPYSPTVKTGIAQHRTIDTFTDTHAIVRSACELLHPTQRKFAPIVVDVCFDYFLARHWSAFSPDCPLPDFGRQVCAALLANKDILPEPLQKRLPLMVTHNFLTTYQTTEGMYMAFRNIAKRSSFETNLAEAVNDVLAHETALENHFLQFFPELQQHCAENIIIFS